MKTGFTGIFALVLAAVLAVTPALTVKEPSDDIPGITEQIEKLRQIVTDWVSGKSAPTVDFYSEVRTRNASASNNKFKNKKVMTYYTNINSVTYLREWAGGKYVDGIWYIPEDSLFEKTRQYTGGEYILPLSRFGDVYSKEFSAPDLLTDMGFVRDSVYVESNGGGRLLSVPQLAVIEPFGTSDGENMELSRMNDGIYSVKNLKRGDKYQVEALIPAFRTGTAEDALLEFLKKYRTAWENGEVIFGTRKVSDPSSSLFIPVESGDISQEMVKALQINNECKSALGTIYTSSYSAAIEKLIKEMISDGVFDGYLETYNPYVVSYDSGIPVNDNEGKAYFLSEYNISVYADKIAKAVCNYLSKNYSYSLNPPKSTSDDPMEEFLFISKEGYCVQFATAATLVMQRLGFTARYAEGYIASEFKRSSGDTEYKAEILDKHGHAWMELWIDGIGWLPYEATAGYNEVISDNPPPSTSAETTKAPDTGTDGTTSGDETTQNTDTENSVSTDGIQSTEPLTTDQTQVIEKGKNMLPLVIVLLSAAVIAAVCYAVLRHSGNKRSKRDKLLRKAAGAGNLTSEELRLLGSQVMSVTVETLSVYGVRHTANELPSEFAVRADRMLEKLGLPVKPSDSIAALSREIYGNGMTKEDVSACASMCLAMSKLAKANLSAAKILRYRYISGII